MRRRGARGVVSRGGAVHNPAPMLVLSDCPDRLAGFFAAGERWVRTAATDLTPPDRALWGSLGTGGTPWTLGVERPAGFWSRILIVAEAPRSQYDRLSDLLAGGVQTPGPVACLALCGRGFHGQRGRSWSAPPGNIYLSVGLTPNVPASPLLPALTMLPAVAVVSAVERATGGTLRPGIKWVNDILIDGRKIAGVLTGSHTKGDTLEGLVMGVGLNVEQAPNVKPTPFVPAVGCLADCLPASIPTRAAFFWALLDALRVHYQSLLSHGPGDLFVRYQGSSVIIGRRVRIFSETRDEPDPADIPLAQGVVLSIAPDLSLRLEGDPNPVTRGRLALDLLC